MKNKNLYNIDRGGITMDKKENGKEKQITITGKTIWIAAIVLNVIPILFKLFNMFYFKHSFEEEFNFTYLMSIIPIFLLLAVTANIEKEEK